MGSRPRRAGHRLVLRHRRPPGHQRDQPFAPCRLLRGQHGPSTAGAFKATLYFAAPDHTTTTDAWFVQQASASKTFPNASAPAPLTGPGFTKPLVSTTIADANALTFINGATLDSTAGYANLIQVRVLDSTSSPKYWSADISYDKAAGTWTQVYPVVSGPTATTTALAVTPASPQNQGTTLTLKATVSPSAAGNVQFFDAATSLGSAAVSGGTAQITNNTLGAGSHTLTATFTPTDSTAFSGIDLECGAVHDRLRGGGDHDNRRGAPREPGRVGHVGHLHGDGGPGGRRRLRAVLRRRDPARRGSGRVRRDRVDDHLGALGGYALDQGHLHADQPGELRRIHVAACCRTP